MSLYTIRYSVWGLPGPFDWLKSTTIHDILKVWVTMATCVFIHPVLLNVERISRIHFEFAFFPSFLADEDNIMTTTTEKAGLALNGPWRNNMNQTKQVGRMLIWYDLMRLSLFMVFEQISGGAGFHWFQRVISTLSPLNAVQDRRLLWAPSVLEKRSTFSTGIAPWWKAGMVSWCSRKVWM